MATATNSRVCDRCIRKKVKCDLQRPNCSRCSEAGYTCTYSTERRRPGPPRGTRRQRGPVLTSDPVLSDTPRTNPTISQEIGTVSVLLPAQTQYQQLPAGSLNTQSTVQDSLPDFNELDLGFSPYGTIEASSDSHPRIQGYSVDAAQERNLLISFFDEINSALPLFHKRKFLTRYDEGGIFRDLIITMVTITAKILGPISYWETQDVDLCMSSLLNSTAFASDYSSAQTTIDQFRLECLLAYYDFHQFPGPPAWMRISRLTRKAHALGINHIENPELCTAFDHQYTSDDDVEDWRYVWWGVYCLDSYSNISSGAPFMVDSDSINTALVRRPVTGDDTPPITQAKILLADDVGELWKTCQGIVAAGGSTTDFNIHLITTTVLRQAGQMLKLMIEKRPIKSKATTLKTALSSLRLALPPRYLNPARNMLRAESSADHHIRLTNLLHLHMCRLILSLPQDLATSEADWQEKSQQPLETCQDIVSVAEHWNNHYSARVDPAICLIIFSALWILNLHRRCIANASEPLRACLIQGENTLLLFLEQFSSMWALPKLLIARFKSNEPDSLMTYLEAEQMLRSFKAPFHPKSIQKWQDSSSPTSSASMGDLFGVIDTNMNLVDMWSFNT
ncbi:hypothetical protein F4778DRAFT_745926 [Xylariomycetidae sp. FL2044]|nr:hypothetical protein F4778DRAFT_745926 [Xylariomycetidae sp. FL2044]